MLLQKKPGQGGDDGNGRGETQVAGLEGGKNYPDGSLGTEGGRNFQGCRFLCQVPWARGKSPGTRAVTLQPAAPGGSPASPRHLPPCLPCPLPKLLELSPHRLRRGSRVAGLSLSHGILEKAAFLLGLLELIMLRFPLSNQEAESQKVSSMNYFTKKRRKQSRRQGNQARMNVISKSLLVQVKCEF